MSSAYSKQDLMNLGRRLVIERPDVAQELLSVVHPEPTETDLALIAIFYTQFSLSQGKPNNRLDKFYKRMLFVSVILHYYIPSAYTIPEITHIKRVGVVQELSVVLNMRKSHVSELVRKTITWYKIYTDFSDEVDKIMEGMTQKD